MNAKSSKGRCVPQVISLIFVGQKLGMMSIDVKLKVTFLSNISRLYSWCHVSMWRDPNGEWNQSLKWSSIIPGTVVKTTSPTTFN